MSALLYQLIDWLNSYKKSLFENGLIKFFLFHTKPQRTIAWKPTGLQNLGNTCFLNSVLQAFASTPSFTRYLEQARVKESLTTTMQNCVKALRSAPSNGDATRVGCIYDMLSRYRKNLGNKDQQDAEECLQALLGILSIELERTKKKAFRSFMHLMYETEEQIPPSLPFEGLMQSTITCCGCNTQRTVKHVTFMDISLPMTPRMNRMSVSGSLSMSGSFTASTFSGLTSMNAGAPNPMAFAASMPPLSLQDCLDRFTEEEELDNVECSNCTFLEYVTSKRFLLDSPWAKTQPAQVLKEIQDELSELESCRGVSSKVESLLGDKPRVRAKATKQLRISRLPKVLCFHLSRRTVDHRTGRIIKIKEKVRFPPILDMQWGGGSSCTSSPCSRDSSQNDSGTTTPDMRDCGTSNCKYRLCAVIEHTGGAESGHYTTYALVGQNPVSPQDHESDRKLSSCSTNDPSVSQIGHSTTYSATCEDAQKEWMHFSDESVIPVTLKDVLEREAYILFYDRLSS